MLYIPNYINKTMEEKSIIYLISLINYFILDDETIRIDFTSILKELSCLIFKNLDLFDVGVCRRVNKHWKKIIDEIGVNWEYIF